MIQGPILGIDTATSRAVIAIGDGGGAVIAADAWPAGQRHSEELLPRIDSLLRGVAITPADLAAIVVGTGPGAFTGLRVGLATGKTLAHELNVPIVGISSADALLLASAATGTLATGGRDIGAPSGARRVRGVLLLPAGSSDRILVRPGAPPELLPGGRDPALEPDELVVAVDLGGRAAPDAVRLGDAAVDGLAAALLRLGADRLAAGRVDDVATLVPEYVTLPRGISQASGDIAWSRDHH